MSAFVEYSLRGIESEEGYGSVDGPFGSNLPATAYTDTGIPVIRGVNLSLGQERFKDYNYVFVGQATAEKLSRSSCKPGDIVFTKKGTLGQTGIVPADSKYKHFILSSNQMRVRVNQKIAEPLYVYYFVSSPYGRNRIIADAMTSGVPKINLTYLRNFKILLPELRVQKKIAAILCSYDDLIENNKRRIALLEKVAEEIYREWFVRFRFPGYQTAEFEKGVPKGWSRRQVNSILDFKSGYAFKSGTYVADGKYGIVTIKNVHDGRFVKECTDSIDELPSRLPKHCQIKDGDILMSLTGNVGRVCIAEGENLLLNQRVAILQPKVETHSHYIYWLFRQDSLQTLSELISTGAAQQNLSPVKLGNQLIVYPDGETLEEYQVKVDPIMKLVMQLRKQISILEATKNRLLPRLISGKLQVENLDIQFLPSMSEGEAA